MSFQNLGGLPDLGSARTKYGLNSVMSSAHGPSLYHLGATWSMRVIDASQRTMAVA